ncbi:MAG TPA: trypsin-like peptidase domain-containing protein, partial [Dehalococcoidales bacterium]|nr:trypsin-like peptidase domain-containing protein [Dehalococcoidales bacterium]
SSVQVVLSNGKTVSATVLGTDTVDDLAVVKVDASSVSGITPLQLGDSSTVQPGETVIAIGSPYGLMNTITAGIISGLNRSVSGSNMTGMLQTDTAINPGNSGGPLLDTTGVVIGINTAIENSANGGIGFAIPSNVAQKALANLIAGKTVVRPMLGITGLDITSANAATLGVSVNQGVYVVSVVSGGAADKAGLKAGGSTTDGAPGTGGDVITGIDGQSITSISQLSAYIATKNVGDTVNLTVLRSGQTLTVAVTLQAWSTGSSTQQQQPRQQMPFQFPNMPRGNNRNSD